jgi:GTP-binding protein EngB required for normal cell division
LTHTQIRVVRDYINRLRHQITRVLNDFEIALPGPKFDSTHAIRVTLQFIEIAVEELAPERLTGYGKVPDSLCHLLAGGLQEMKGIVRQMDSYLIQPLDADVGLRSSRLSGAGELGELLSVLAGIIDRYGFVEFRASLSRLIEKIETPAYEIAFFGRVSAGKSSLLNRIIGADLLPTGVTPITAIPTQIRNRPASGLLVWTADGRFERYEIDRLPDFVTEARNPGNDKRVTRLIADVPLPALPPEVVFVDTPGLGSLALEGATETLAYLPQCDLGVVLVDCSSSLHSDDIATLDALQSASVPSLLALSKADLLSPQDLEQLIKYTRDRVSEQLGTEIGVAPLSSHAGISHFLNAWVTNEIAP